MSTVEDFNWSYHATLPNVIKTKQYPKSIPGEFFFFKMQVSCCTSGDSKSNFTFFPGVWPGNLNFKQTQAGDRGGWRRWVRAHKEDHKSETKAEAPGGGGRSPGESARPNLCGGPLDSPAWPWVCLLISLPEPPYPSASGPRFLETAPQGQIQASRPSQECTVKRPLTPQIAPGGKGQSLSP